MLSSDAKVVLKHGWHFIWSIIRPLFSGRFFLCTFGSFPKFLKILSRMQPGLKLLMLYTVCIRYAWNLSNKIQSLYLKKEMLGPVVWSDLIDNNQFPKVFSLLIQSCFFLVSLVMFLTTSTIFSECLSICIATSWNLSKIASCLASSFARISLYFFTLFSLYVIGRCMHMSAK